MWDQRKELLISQAERAPERFPRGVRIWGHLRNAQNRRLGRDLGNGIQLAQRE